MSYEVYIDLRHHPRHLDDGEQHLSHCGRYSLPLGTDPSDAERLRTVVASLRDMANRYDPDWHCTACDKPRHEHIGYPSGLVYCSSTDFRPTQWSSWREVQE